MYKCDENKATNDDKRELYNYLVNFLQTNDISTFIDVFLQVLNDLYNGGANGNN